MNCDVRAGNRYIAGPHSLLARVTQILPTRVCLGSISGGLKGALDNSHLVPAPLTGRFPPARYSCELPRTLSELEFVFLALQSVAGNWILLKELSFRCLTLLRLVRFHWWTYLLLFRLFLVLIWFFNEERMVNQGCLQFIGILVTFGLSLCLNCFQF